MRLIDIIQNHKFEQVGQTLQKLYPEEELAIPHYERVWDSLKLITVEKPTWDILVMVVDDDDNHPWYDVTGVDIATEDDLDFMIEKVGQPFYKAIEFQPWGKWLGADIHPSCACSFTELEIIAHCLWEMTFCSYDQEEIQAEINDLRATMEEILESLDDEDE